MEQGQLFSTAPATHIKLKQYEPMVHKFVNELMRKIRITDGSVEREDLVQTAWLYVAEAVNQYNPHRGCKLSTFIFLKLMTKFSNITRGLVAYTRKGIVQMPEHLMGLCDQSVGDDGSYDDEGIVERACTQHKQMEAGTDLMAFIDALDHQEQRVVRRHFMYGEQPWEIAKRYNFKNTQRVQALIGNIRAKADQYIGGQYADSPTYSN